jgi:diguanylate cyclase (GGDEF)-like protein
MSSLLALAPLVVIAGNVSPLFVPLVLIPLLVVGQLNRYIDEEARKASTDELTGLPNRKALYSQMRSHARAFGKRRRSRQTADGSRMALLMLDVDQFRQVNEALGHSVGDRLLVAVAHRLRDAMGSDGLVVRLGGDEFAVLAPRLTDPDASAVLARRVADALADPVLLDGLPVDVTAAMGVAVYPDHGADVITLLRHAETAMYDSKERGATFAIYTPESEQHSPERLALLADLRRALDNDSDELELHYQPQVTLATGEVAGAESLLRWSHPVHGFVSPDTIIKMAEHTALMGRITTRVLDDAIAQLAEWRSRGLRIRVSVNVSARDLHRGEFVDELAKLLAVHDVPANLLQLEITEGALLADQRRAMLTLHRLDRLGVALSLDDFGTGYSSLQHLRRMPIAEVKIDKSFVLGMAADPDDASIVGSVVDLGRRLGLRVVAEGVEDEETRRHLLEIGCEVGQGWHFARPMRADAFLDWLGRYPHSEE